jgi:two-component system, NtrC family, response regulator HupR/HoxA
MVMERLDRFPLYVPVQSTLWLAECWSENVSLGGIGLLGRPGPQGPPTTGQSICVEFALPNETVVAFDGVVRWVAPRDGGVVAFGLAFVRPLPGALEQIARLAPRPVFRIVVVGADTHWRRRLRDIGGTAIAVEFVDDIADVPTFDVAVVIRSDGGNTDLPPAIDENPHVLLAGALDDDVIQVLRNGLARGALTDDDDDDAIRDALYAACRDWGARLALRRTALRLTRDLEDVAAESPRRTGRRPEREGRPAPGDGLDLVADSPAMAETLATVDVVAPHKVVVLIQGETGAGKEVLARTIHRRSSRRDRAFIVQDCGTLTETLLDSELFGHVRGAFTGANADHPGVFVVADGGTVFLDEIQNTSPALQAKLLRVIETGEVRPVGGSRARVVDVRIIAAANVDLEAAVREGRFRADLYYRLAAFPIRLPPLRERGRDIVTLARRLAAAAAATHGLPRPVLQDDVEEALLGWPWPGNVRQLKNVLERAVILAGGGAIALRHLPPEFGHVPARTASLEERVRAFERGVIAEALEEANGILVRAAAALYTNRVTLARKARAHGLLR